MRIRLLGTGTSTGVPVVGCQCNVCRSQDPRDKRTRASILVERSGRRFLIDASADFRAQALRHDLSHLDAVLLTHAHSDHIGGIDDLRGITFLRKEPLPIYGTVATIEEVKLRYSYLFSGVKPEGGAVARLEPRILPSVIASQSILGVEIISFPLPHGSSSVLGFRFGKAAYLTDLHQIPDEIFRMLTELDLLILDCTRIAPHKTHLHFDLSLEYAARIGAKRTVLTHLGHDFGYELWQTKCPSGVELGIDGTEYNVSEL